VQPLFLDTALIEAENTVSLNVSVQLIPKRMYDAQPRAHPRLQRLAEPSVLVDFPLLHRKQAIETDANDIRL